MKMSIIHYVEKMFWKVLLNWYYITDYNNSFIKLVLKIANSFGRWDHT